MNTCNVLLHLKSLLFKTNKMNGHFMGFRQLVQKFEQVLNTNNFHFQDKQNEWSFYGFSTTGSKFERITLFVSTLIDFYSQFKTYLTETNNTVTPRT